MATAVVTKADVLANMREAWAEWEALLNEAGPERMEEPGVEGVWSMREVVAHLTPYTRRTALRLEHATAGTTPSPSDLYGIKDVPDMTGWNEDDFNAWSVSLARDRSTEMIVSDFRDAWRRLETVIEAMSEDDLTASGRFAFTRGNSVLAILPINSYEHLDMHIPTIRAWLSSRAS